jgi:hypothetical protein
VREAVYRAIPYDGPVVNLTGASDFDTVSNSITLQADIADLSGTSNEQASLLVNGVGAQVTRTNNSFTLDTRYAVNSSVSGLLNEVEVTVENTNAVVTDPTTFVADTKQVFDTTVTRTLDFENSTYVAFASDMCSPDVGTNQMIFGIDQAQNVSAVIKDAASGRTLASLSGYVPFPATVVVPWDFTETNGAPFTNDTYTVTFTA